MAYFDESDFDPDRSVGYLIRRAQQMNVAAMETVFSEQGVSVIQWSALITVHLKRGTTAADIARDLSYDKGATTRLIDTMEQRGWMTRSRCSADRRIVNLELTDEGRAIAIRCKQHVIAAWNEWLDDWKDDDITTLILLLQKLRDTLEAVTGQKGTCA